MLASEDSLRNLHNSTESEMKTKNVITNEDYSNSKQF